MTVFEGRVESISFSGGVVRFDKNTFFVPFTCPGDVVRARVVNEKKNAAALIGLVKASPHRVEPPCHLFGICGGCVFQHISYEKQVEEKKNMVADSLERIGGLKVPPCIEMVTSPPYGYRNRIGLHRDGSIIGFKQAGSSTVIPLPDCPVAVPVVRQFARQCMQDAAEGKHSQKRFAVYGFDDQIAVEGSDTERLFIPGLGITMDARIFFQSNLEMQKKLVADVSALAGEGDAVADMYGGVGVFAYALAPHFKKLFFIEGNPAAVALARENLRNVPSQTEYYALSLETYCAMIAKTAVPKLPRWDAAIVDPPREGLCASLISLFIRLKTPRLVYVSCNPVTFARDAKRLCEGGFSLESITCYDFYPQTPHIECAALFCFSDRGCGEKRLRL
jgi:tRNA/tmRNA/rRNA uracil-C5-methylase (TrmA/RlmC/RlmD family)